jgi:hypothetical protein
MPCLLALLSALATLATSARADSLGLDPANFPDPNAIISPERMKIFVRTLGTVGAQRPYEPATPLGTFIGLDVGISLTAVKIPQDFFDQLTQISSANAASSVPIIPVPTLQVHKGIGSRVDVGGFFVAYRGEGAWGGDLKVAVWLPEEGPTWALRLGYSHLKVSFFTVDTFSPQILASRKLDFADPYIGAGLDIMQGTATLKLSDFGTLSGVPDLELSASNHAIAAVGFLGVSLRLPEIGFRITLEMAYNTSGAHTMGTKVGFAF